MDELNKVLSWLESHIPLAIKWLDIAGDTDSQLLKLETELEFSLPSQFKALYRLYDGTKNNHGAPDAGLFFDLFLMSVSEIKEYRNIHQSLLEPIDSIDIENTYRVKQRELHFDGIAAKKWVPFAHDGGGNFIGLDFEPACGGKAGQVITFGRDEYENYVLAPSFTHFLSWYLGELVKPSLVIKYLKTPGLEGSVDYQIYQTGGFLGSVSRMYEEGLITK